MADVLKKVPVREQAPKVRATNFEEVCLGYNKEEAMEEANRCLGCKKAKCMEGCPVSINIPGFVHEVKEGNFEKAYQIIGESSALPAVCGRVCPQETQCEGKCIRGLKGEAVSIGKLERFVADWAKENGIKPVPAADVYKRQRHCNAETCNVPKESCFLRERCGAGGSGKLRWNLHDRSCYKDGNNSCGICRWIPQNAF